MFGSTTLEVAIGLVFIYLLFSLFATAINEGIATFINKRGKNLFEGIKNLLNDPDFTELAQQVYSHGLVDGISQYASDTNKPNRAPSYMSSNTFALALIDILGARGVAASLPDQAALDAAYNQAKTASTDADTAALGAPGGSTLAVAATTAKAALADVERQQDLARAVTTAAYTQAQADYDAAKAKAVGAPNDPALAIASATAKAAPDAAKVQYDAAVPPAPPETQGKINADPAKILGVPLLSQASQEVLRAGRILAAEHPDPLANIQAAVESLPTGPTQESLLVLIAKTRRDVALITGRATTVADQVEEFQKNIEKWFNDAMDRIAGWYKRWAQVCLLVIGCVLVLAANADTLTLAKRFDQGTALRTAVVAAADDVVKNPKGGAGSAVDQVQPILKATEQFNLPLGWIRLGNDPLRMAQTPMLDWTAESASGQWSLLGKWLFKLLGLMMTVAAISLGAPFWFDTLSKLINIRGAGTPPGGKKKSAPQTESKQGK